MVCNTIFKNYKALNRFFMKELMNKIAQIGNTLEKNSKDADNDRILFERVHYTIKTLIQEKSYLICLLFYTNAT
jgi:hypothetical protein